MNSKSWTLVVGVWGVTGCIDGDTRTRDVTDTSEPSEVDPGVVSIRSFTSDFASITRGTDFRGREVLGEARLSWETTGASSVELLVDGVKVALDGCEPGDCVAAGSLVVQPTERTRFTLRALGECIGPCPEVELELDVLAPVSLSFVPQNEVVQPGQDVVVDYTVTGHRELAVGLVDLAGPTLQACTPQGVPCAATFVDGVLASGGQLLVAGVDRRQFLGIEATNGADDGLGDIGPATFFLEVGVPVVIGRFEVVPARALPGDEVVLSWEVAGAQAVSVQTTHGLDGLTTCVGLGDDGAGFCTVTLDAAAPLAAVDFVLRAEQVGGQVGEAQARLEVIGGPQIASVSATPPVAVAGQTVTLEWTAFGADEVVWQGVHVDGLERCTALVDGRGSCEVSVLSDAADELALTMTASHRAVGPAASRTLILGIEAAPEVLGFEVDDPTVEPGTTVVLNWEVAHAEEVQLVEDSGVIGPGELSRCAATTTAGQGSCAIEVPRGLAPGTLSLELEAIGSTSARSEVAVVVVEVGFRPSAELIVTPALLPQGGGDVALIWGAPGASRAEVKADGVVVMTSGETLCEGMPCDATGDTFRLGADRATEYLLVAENEFGRGLASVSVHVEGAPVITRFELDGVDALPGVVEMGPAAVLSWEVAPLQNADEVRLERADARPDEGCAEVATWVLADGFPRVGAEAGVGQASVELEEAATCLRLVVTDLDTTPNQRDVAVVLAYRAPEIETFGVADNTLQAGDSAVLSWSTKRAYRVGLEVSPVGAVTSQELAACVYGVGCEVQIQPGTPLGEVRFTLVAIGERASTSAPRDLPVSIGVGPSIGTFTATPASSSTPTAVTLRWTSASGSALVIQTASEEVFVTTERAVMDRGEHQINVTTTTTFELEVSNSFGVATAQATTFVGPSIDTLTANGGDARDGLETVITGPVTVSWSTTSAEGSHVLETAGVPANANCTTATGWAVVYSRETPTAAASHPLGVVTSNRCVRLTVANTQSPPQTSRATFLLREMPEVATLTASPGTLNGSGTVIIEMGVRGATALSVTAQYRNNAGEVLGTRAVCDEGRVNSGTLSGQASIDQVECAHQVTPCNLLCLNNGMPSGTTRVRYAVSVNDGDNDAATRDTSGADVVVQ